MMEQWAHEDCERQLREINERVTSLERSFVAVQNAMIRFGARVAHVVKQVETLGQKA